MLPLGTPVFNNSQRFLSKVKSIDLSSRVISGLIETPGDSASFLRFATIENTSHERDILTKIGLRRAFVYFPILTQSRIDCPGMVASIFCIRDVMSWVSFVLRVYLEEPSGHSFMPLTTKLNLRSGL